MTANDQNDQSANLPTDLYWAAVPKERLADTVRAKALAFRKKVQEDGRIDLWKRAERTYYGQDAEGGYANSASVTYGGENGELVLIRINHFHSIAQGILTTVAKQRPAFDARALSTDTEALGEAELATGVIEAYYRELGLEAIELNAARMGWVLAEGWTAIRWNPFKGRVIGKSQRPVLEDGVPKMEQVERETMGPDGVTIEVVEQPVTEEWPEREGDIEAQAFSPYEVIRNLDSPSRELEWCILPYRENVWDLAARYPEYRDQILANRMQQRWARSAWNNGAWETPRNSDDMVTVWWLYHMPTSAMPQGRHAQVVGDVVIYDGPMNLEEVPCYGLIPECEMVTASGYSLSYDLLALCAAYDSIWDVILSSHDALGMQNIIAPKNSDVNAQLLARGLRLIGYTPKPGVANDGKPEALQLLAISADSFKLVEILPHLMETLSGLNSVARGEPAPNLKSGTALALVQSLAVSFNSGFQGEVVRHHERVATGVLRLLKRFAKTKRMSEITGRTERSAMREWSADSFSQVSRIAVEIASPLLQSESGRLQVGQDLLQAGLIKTPQKYLEVLATGNLKAEYESELSRVRHIRDENQKMLDGVQQVVGKYDDHVPHIMEHLGLLDSPEARENDALVQMVMEHVDQHIAIWSTMPPAVALATRQSVMPLPPPMPMGPPPPAGPPAKGGPPEKPEPPKAAPLGQDGGPNMPNMPAPPPNAPPT